MLGKNKFCDEKLSDLVLVEGGSKCLRCKKVLKDLATKSFSEMEEIQSSESTAHCGIYAKRQFKYRNQLKPFIPFSFGEKRIALMFILSFLLFSSSPIKASVEIDNALTKNHQETGLLEKFPVSEDTNQIPDIERVIIQGVVIDSLSQQPLHGAAVYIESLDKGVYTDEQGGFLFVLEENVEISYPLKVQIKYLGYLTKEMEWNNKGNQFLQINLIYDNSLDITEVPLIYRVTKSPSEPSASPGLWWKVKNVFRRKNRR